MNVWYCAEHREIAESAEPPCQAPWLANPCRIDPYRLVPFDALVLVRDADGEDGLAVLYSHHDDGARYINTDLETQVAEAIRRYPASDAPGWLAPIAAILVVEKWILDALAEAAKDNPHA